MTIGRPKLKTGLAKSSYLRIRVTIADRKEISRRAKAAKSKTDSAWVRHRLLGDD